MTKQQIQTELDNITYALDGATISAAICDLTKLQAQHGEDATISVEIVPDPYDGYDDVKVSIVGIREENDYEFEKRLRNEAQVRDNDLAQLAYLKKKYEGN